MAREEKERGEGVDGPEGPDCQKGTRQIESTRTAYPPPHCPCWNDGLTRGCGEVVGWCYCCVTICVSSALLTSVFSCSPPSINQIVYNNNKLSQSHKFEVPFYPRCTVFRGFGGAKTASTTASRSHQPQLNRPNIRRLITQNPKYHAVHDFVTLASVKLRITVKTCWAWAVAVDAENDD
jgi:hypothetical protein